MSAGAPHFSCQQCKSPLQIPLKTDALQSQAAQSLGESFVVLAEDKAAARLQASSLGKQTDFPIATSISERIVHAEKLFDMATDRCQIDHPLCVDCAESVIRDLDAQLAMKKEEKEAYKVALDELNNSTRGVLSEKEFKEEMAILENEDEELLRQLKDMEVKQKVLQEEMDAMEAESASLDHLEKRYWQDFNDFQLDLQICNEERDSLREKIEHASEQVELLKKTNIFNDAFHIWHDGHFGTINNFRLGRLPSQPVDWDEINAAWGQAALLLDVLATHCSFRFSEYRVIPMGSYSKMAKICDEKVSYELYGTNDFKLFGNSRFDKAMIWYLHCLKEFGEWVENQDKEFRLPFRIEGDKIGDLSIKVQFHQDQKWTNALKHTLTDLKWLLGWVARNI